MILVTGFGNPSLSSAILISMKIEKCAARFPSSIKKPSCRRSDFKSAFKCPVARRPFYEEMEPLLDRDAVDCPRCEGRHRITAPIGGGMATRYASGWYARRHAFRFSRSDRGAIEFVATRKTNSKHWVKDGERIYAYAIGECIFWPSIAMSKQEDTFLHELCHVRQSRKHGAIMFIVKYWWEQLRNGYEKNKYERHARRAERRAYTSCTGNAFGSA